MTKQIEEMVRKMLGYTPEAVLDPNLSSFLDRVEEFVCQSNDGIDDAHLRSTQVVASAVATYELMERMAHAKKSERKAKQ